MFCAVFLGGLDLFFLVVWMDFFGGLDVFVFGGLDSKRSKYRILEWFGMVKSGSFWGDLAVVLPGFERRFMVFVGVCFGFTLG